MHSNVVICKLGSLVDRNYTQLHTLQTYIISSEYKMTATAFSALVVMELSSLESSLIHLFNVNVYNMTLSSNVVKGLTV